MLGPQPAAPVPGSLKGPPAALRPAAASPAAPAKPETDRQRFIRLFFSGDAYETVRQRKRDHDFYPMVEIPKGTAIPWKLQSSGECAILTEVINETVDNQNLENWTYEDFLAYIEGVMTSPERPPSQVPAKIVGEGETKGSRVHDRQQVAVVLELSDKLLIQQLNRILGAGI
jgi:hypothetical protein